MIIIIDNYDSFTYNLYQLAAKGGKKVEVFKNNEITVKQIKKFEPSRIIISPGPGSPENSGISIKAIKEFYKTIPILGVCLGHECIGEIFGSKIIKAKNIYHGKTSKIKHNKKKLFENLKNPFPAARYHSLIVDKVPDNFNLDAWTVDKEIMAISHQKYPLFGVQFHPESFLTEEGDKLIKNFLMASAIAPL